MGERGSPTAGDGGRVACRTWTRRRTRGGSDRDRGLGGFIAAAVRNAPKTTAPAKPADTSVAVGMGRDDEWMVRQALRAARLSNDCLIDDDDDDEYAFVEGDRCLALWEEDGEWYDASVVDVGDTWIVVYFDDWDFTEELIYDEDHVVPHPDAPPGGDVQDGGGAGAGASSSSSSRGRGARRARHRRTRLERTRRGARHSPSLRTATRFCAASPSRSW